MHMDALTLAAVADELTESLRAARVDDIYQPTPDAVALQVYGQGRNRWLLASASPQLARIHLVERKPRKLVSEPPAFVMLLRKYVEGARVVALRQPRWERIVELGFARGPAGSPPSVWLVVEIMGRLSNIILRGDDGTILGALHQVSAEVNHYRAIQPHVQYTPPPPQTRMLGGEAQPRLRGEVVTAEELRAAAEDALAREHEPATPGSHRRKGRRDSLTLAGLLSVHLEGFSRELGREVAARTLGQPDVPLALDLPWDDVALQARLLAALPGEHAWAPTLVHPLDEPDARPEAYAVYTPQQYGDARLEEVPTANEMLARYYEGAEWRSAVEGAKGDLRRLLQTLHERAARKEEALLGELRQQQEAQTLREEADTLLAYQAEIPEHADSFTTENPFAVVGSAAAAATMTIALDPRLTAVENANVRYNRYHKLQRAAGLIPPQIEANKLELARIEQLQTDLALAETPAEIAAVREVIAEAGYLRGAGRPATADRRGGGAVKQAKGAKAKGKPGAKGGGTQKRSTPGGQPLRQVSSDDIPLLIGKNSRQNEEVTFSLAGANDIWLHARGVPGAHVIVKSGGRPVPERTLREAAALAAYYSQARHAGSVPVDYTEQRYVRHIKGGGPGMVTYEREHTLHVAPATPGADSE